MTTREQVLEWAALLPGSGHDMPFEGDFDSTVLRHAATGKWFGLLMKVRREKVGLPGEGITEILNLKCDPLMAYGMMAQYPDIIPAYHMNKHHWITVRLEGDVPEDVVRMLMEQSWRLTEARRQK